MTLRFNKTPTNRLEVRVHGQKIFKNFSTIALLLALVNVGAGFGFHNPLYHILAAVLFVPAVAMRTVWRGKVLFVEKGRGKVKFRTAFAEKGEAKVQEWPEKELTEARMTSRQVFVGKDKQTRYLVGLTRRSLRPAQLLEIEELDEAVEFATRLIRLVRCEFVDATVQPPDRYSYEEIGNLRRRLRADAEEGERVERPGALDRQRRGSGYEYRWKRQSSSGATFWALLALVALLGPFYALQVTIELWPMFGWLLVPWFGYLAFLQWATVYRLTIEATGLTYVDGRRANVTQALKWEHVRGVQRKPRGSRELLEIRAIKPMRIDCSTKPIAAFLEEQVQRAQQRWGPAPAPRPGSRSA